MVQTAPGEVYTALERGVVDGYGWPITGIFDLGWHEKTKYRVDPGFYSAEVSVLVNKSVWDKLNDEQKAVLRRPAAEGEAEAPAEFAKENAADTERQAEAGIETIKFDEAAREELSRQGLRGGLGGRHPAEPGARAEAQGVLLEISVVDERARWSGCPIAYGRLLDAMLLIACVLLLGMTLLIGADVLLRNSGSAAFRRATSSRKTPLSDHAAGRARPAAAGAAHPHRHRAARAAAARRLAAGMGRRRGRPRLLRCISSGTASA